MTGLLKVLLLSLALPLAAAAQAQSQPAPKVAPSQRDLKMDTAPSVRTLPGDASKAMAAGLTEKEVLEQANKILMDLIDAAAKSPEYSKQVREMEAKVATNQATVALFRAKLLQQMAESKQWLK